MDNTKQAEAIEKYSNGRIPVIEVGSVCVYCGAETEVGCCAEVHHEIGYETKDGELVLESELTEAHVIVEEL